MHPTAREAAVGRPIEKDLPSRARFHQKRHIYPWWSVRPVRPGPAAVPGHVFRSTGRARARADLKENTHAIHDDRDDRRPGG